MNRGTLREVIFQDNEPWKFMFGIAKRLQELGATLDSYVQVEPLGDQLGSMHVYTIQEAMEDLVRWSTWQQNDQYIVRPSARRIRRVLAYPTRTNDAYFVFLDKEKDITYIVGIDNGNVTLLETITGDNNEPRRTA